MTSHFTIQDEESKNTDDLVKTEIAYYKGALVAVRKVNKMSVNLDREDLIEMNKV